MSTRQPSRLSVERLDAHPHRFKWPERWARRIGKMPDGEVAALAGVSKDAVIAERRRRGIRPYRAQRRPIAWTEAMLRLLGTDTDLNVAAELGIQKQDVFRKRRILGIPSYALGTFRPPGFHWSRRALALLGTAADSNVARRLGVSTSTVLLKRLELEIPSHHRRAPPVNWSPEMVALLGKVADTEICRRFGMTVATVKRKRDELGIPSPLTPRMLVRTRRLSDILKLANRVVREKYGIAKSTITTLRRELGVRSPDRWPEDKVARLGRESDTTVALALGLSKERVGQKRRSLGIPAHYPKRLWTKAECALLGRMADAEIARQLGRSLVAVQLKRRLLGIPRPRGRKRYRAESGA